MDRKWRENGPLGNLYLVSGQNKLPLALERCSPRCAVADLFSVTMMKTRRFGASTLYTDDLDLTCFGKLVGQSAINRIFFMQSTPIFSVDKPLCKRRWRPSRAEAAGFLQTRPGGKEQGRRGGDVS
eukprot:scaffold139157_cov33-Tisochrysis_lutea.AAC.2